jgi:AcrR family transcriptional regulator
MSTDSTSIGLREQKKALTRATLEARALERFLAEGYEPVRLEDLCAECLVSTRTFFRYFTSKECSPASSASSDHSLPNA